MNAPTNAPTASSTTTPTPHELLRQLAGWMSASKFADDHPWRVAIEATLADHPSTPPAGTGLSRPAQECGDRVRFELHPVLAGLSLLTNSVRVLQAVSDHAFLSKPFADALCEACPSWSDPFAHGGDASAESVVSDLARYAADLCAAILVTDLNGGAA